MESKESSIININSLHGYNESTCGYCNSKSGSISCGFATNQLALNEYQCLMDRGWRRCGEYFYKPEVNKSCCQPYTIRLQVNKYQMRKSQKKVMKKFEKFLAGGNLPIKGHNETEIKEEPINIDKSNLKKKDFSAFLSTELKMPDEVFLTGILESLIESLEKNNSTICQLIGMPEGTFQIKERTKKEFKLMKTNNKKFGEYFTNLIMLIYADNKMSLEQAGIKKLFDLILKIKHFIQHFLEPILDGNEAIIQDNGYIGIKMKKEEITQEEKKFNDKMEDNQQKDYKKGGQDSRISIEEDANIGKKSKKENQVAMMEEELKPRNFCIKFEKAIFEQESFDLYTKYNSKIHGKEKEDVESYKSFLCSNVLKFDKLKNGDIEVPLGCYHMKYFIDEKLIAIGVVDLLPTCLSSVYFFYDPEYKSLSPGIVGAIKEIEYVQEKSKTFPDFRYYYLGYYIQNCQKMVYKADYEPAELLCPCTYNWVILTEELKKKIDSKEKRLSGKQAVLLVELDFSSINLEKFVKEKIKLNINGPIKLIQLNKKFQEYFMTVFKDIAIALGKDLASSFVFALVE